MTDPYFFTKTAQNVDKHANVSWKLAVPCDRVGEAAKQIVERELWVDEEATARGLIVAVRV